MRYIACVLGLVGTMLTGPLYKYEAYGQSAGLAQDERLIPLITVDSDSISLGLYKKSYVDFLIMTGANDTEGNRQRHIQALTDAYVLGKDARRRGLTRDSSFQAFSRLQRKKALGGRYYERIVIDNIDTLSDEEKRIAYAKYMSKVHVRQLYFADHKTASAYYKRLEQGEDFIDLANEVYGTVEYDSLAGDMGFISYFEMDDAIAETAFNLNQRFEYSRPIRSRKGYHILRLEDRLTTPILTESAYQAHGQGVGEEMNLRTIRMRGDAYVRAFMDSLEYVLEEAAIQALANQIKEMVDPEESDPEALFLSNEEALSIQEAQQIQAALTPETPLVRYQWEGEERIFTAGDFFAWVHDVPYAELKANPVASVGRALRNEVLGLAGERVGLHADPIVQESVFFEEQIFLASRMREALREDPSMRPTEDMVKAAFDRLTQNRAASIAVDYWSIEAASLEDARWVLSRIKEGEKNPDAFSTYESFAGADVYEDLAWASHLRQAPLNKPMITGLSGARWAVFEVTSRKETPYRYEDVRASLEAQLAPYAGEYFLLKQLYDSANIEIDHTLFNFWPTVRLPQE